MRNRIGFPILEALGMVLILLATIVFTAQIGQYTQLREELPRGLVVAEVPVGGLSRAEAQAVVEEVYATPINVTYRGQAILLDPQAVNFTVNSESMFSEADGLATQGEAFWAGFWDFLWRRPEQTTSIALEATYSQELLNAWLADVAARYDSPPTEAQPALDSLSFRAGEPGYTLDIEASRARIDEALFEPLERSVELVIDEQAQPQADIDSLGDLLIDYVDASGFTGVASVFVVDLQTGDELELNIDTRDGGTPSLITCDIAYASMSTMKIPIMVDYFRHLERLPERDPQRDDAYKLLIETMTLSGNISANFMMQSSGFGDLERGVENVTQTAQYLGLENTFIVAGYDVEDPPEYYSTPAREAARDGSCVNTRPDAYMQTTIRDMALLLDMIYQCSEFGGGLTAAYPDAITQADCQMMLETMADNEEGVLILAGVPQDIDVAHKHGWISDTHGDAGVVFTPGGDYVLVMTLWADVAWLNFQESFPVLQDISAAVFNYFNPDRINDPRRGLSPLETGEELPPPPPPSDDEGDTS